MLSIARAASSKGEAAFFVGRVCYSCTQLMMSATMKTIKVTIIVMPAQTRDEGVVNINRKCGPVLSDGRPSTACSRYNDSHFGIIC